MRHEFRRRSGPARRGAAHKARPLVENLEGRLLLYSASGGAWPHPNLITYSFVPDGTNYAGSPSDLFATMNAKFPQASWETAFEIAAATWEQVANINLVQVSDDGEPMGNGPDEQGNPNFGDIRIGGLPSSVLGTGTLAYTLYPPPINGNSSAGDVMINTSQQWSLTENYDLVTVAIHEFGHALGLGESLVQQAVMYGTYTGVNEQLASDDIAGIQSIYGARQPDYFMATQNNSTWQNAANLTPYINQYDETGFGPADLQTPLQNEWYKVTVPAGTNGTMTVTMQAAGLSLLAPGIAIYNSSLQYLGYNGSYNQPSSTTAIELVGVKPGQTYYMQTFGDGAPVYSDGDYALFVNFSANPLYPFPSPVTTTANQESQGGGGGLDATPRSGTGAASSWLTNLQQIEQSGVNDPWTGSGQNGGEWNDWSWSWLFGSSGQTSLVVPQGSSSDGTITLASPSGPLTLGKRATPFVFAGWPF